MSCCHTSSKAVLATAKKVPCSFRNCLSLIVVTVVSLSVCRGSLLHRSICTAEQLFGYSATLLFWLIFILCTNAVPYPSISQTLPSVQFASVSIGACSVFVLLGRLCCGSTCYPLDFLELLLCATRLPSCFVSYCPMTRLLHRCMVIIQVNCAVSLYSRCAASPLYSYLDATVLMAHIWSMAS